MIYFNETAYLTDRKIAEWADASGKAYLRAAGRRALPEAKVRLAVEELLLKFRETYGTETPCRLVCRKALGQIRMELSQPGPQENPIAQPEEGMQLSYDILVRLGVRAKYSYSARRRMNYVIMPAEVRPIHNRMMFTMLAALALAVICCFGLRAISGDAAQFLYEGLTKPVFDKLIAVITALATPLVFLAVITGITGVGDAAAFGKIGSKVCGAMGFTYLIAAVVLAVFSALGYPPALTAASAEGGGVLGQTVQMVLDIIPNNLVEPFAIDNDLQVITFSVFIGVVMLLLGNELHALNGLIQDAANLVNKMMALVCRLLPLVVFLGIFNLLYTSNPADFVSIYKMFVLFVIVCALILLITILRVRLVTKVPFRILFRKMLPTLMINLTTSSQVAALPENMHCCKDKFGIDGKLVDFALPLGIVVFMPCGAVFLGLTVLSLASLSGIALTASAFVKIVIVSVILAIAAPPIPGSAFAVMPIMFTACGVPESVYPLAVVMGTIIGYLLPALNGFLLQLQLLLVAVKMGKLDMDALRAAEAK